MITDIYSLDLLIVKRLKEDEVRPFRLKIKSDLSRHFNTSIIFFDVIVDSENRINSRISMGDLFYNKIYWMSALLM